MSHTEFTVVTRMELKISTLIESLLSPAIFQHPPLRSKQHIPYPVPETGKLIEEALALAMWPIIPLSSITLRCRHPSPACSTLHHTTSSSPGSTHPYAQIYSSPCPCLTCGASNHQQDLDLPDASCACLHDRDRPRRDLGASWYCCGSVWIIRAGNCTRLLNLVGILD